MSAPDEGTQRRMFADPRLGIGASVAGLLLVNAHALWVPWTHGLVTDAFAEVVLPADVGLAVHLVGWIAVLRAQPGPRWKRVAAPLFVGAALWPVWVFHDVFPLDLSAVGLGGAEAAARFGLGLAVLAVGVGLVMTLMRAGGAALELAAPEGPARAPVVEDRATEVDRPAERRRPAAQRPPPPRSRRHR